MLCAHRGFICCFAFLLTLLKEKKVLTYLIASLSKIFLSLPLKKSFSILYPAPIFTYLDVLRPTKLSGIEMAALILALLKITDLPIAVSICLLKLCSAPTLKKGNQPANTPLKPMV